MLVAGLMIVSELLRPQFHFTAPAGWLNDPNGLVYENGRYHLFYQHNPFGTEWGNMTWGHATSKDLIHWTHLPHALTPDDLGPMFSGSAVIDKANSSGFGKNSIVALYTAAGGTNDASKGKPFTQCLAWTKDGNTFTKLSSNPVVGHLAGENRDPKVFWHEASKKWVMALYLTGDNFALLGSQDLKEWRELSRFRMEGTDECPDMFELAIDGDSKRKAWVFWGANGNYKVGDFDGTTFLPKSPILRSQHGNTGYAAQTYDNAPRGRRIQITWFRGSVFPSCPWNQQMGFPTDLTLRTTESGAALAIQPVSEIQTIRGPLVKEEKGRYGVDSGLVDLEGSWSVPASGALRIEVNGVGITVDAGKISALGKEADLDLRAGKLDLRVLADRTSIEVYAQKGLVYMPFFVLPVEGAFKGVSVMGAWKGKVRVFELKPNRAGL